MKTYRERFFGHLDARRQAALLQPDRSHAFYLRGTVCRELAPLSGAAPALPRRLLIPPGRYRIHGRTFDLRAEGIYRFLWPVRDNQQRIVYRSDRWALLSSLCWLVTHGSRDDRKPFPALERQALTAKLIRTCGPMSAFCVDFLNRHGVPARTVGARSVRNIVTWDVGHELLEVRLDGRWALIDVDQHAAFRHGGRRLSALEAWPRFQTGAYTFERLARSAGLAIGSFFGDGFDFDLWAESTLLTEPALRRWYKRVTHALMLRDPAGRSWAYAVSPSDRRRAALVMPRLKGRVLSKPDFTRKFYARGTGEINRR